MLMYVIDIIYTYIYIYIYICVCVYMSTCICEILCVQDNVRTDSSATSTYDYEFLRCYMQVHRHTSCIATACLAVPLLDAFATARKRSRKDVQEIQLRRFVLGNTSYTPPPLHCFSTYPATLEMREDFKYIPCYNLNLIELIKLCY